MKAMLAVAITLSVALIVVAAQAASTQQPSDRSNPRITVIGCIQRAPQSPAATTGTTAIPEGGTRYVLSNITLAADTPSAPGGTAAAVEQAVKMYRLDDSADSLIAPHVGDRVEVSGTLGASAPAPRGTTGRSEPSDAALENVPMLKVESVRKISTAPAMCAQ